MDEIEIISNDLTMRDPETGRCLTSNVYRVDGIDRDLSMSELVMAICLQRAAELEKGIVRIMDEMSQTTANLEALAQLQVDALEVIKSDVDFQAAPNANVLFWAVGKSGHTYAFYDEDGTRRVYDTYGGSETKWNQEKNDMLRNVLNVDLPEKYNADAINKRTPDDYITIIGNRMDEWNSLSQEKLIELQSQTSKRDQSYELISAMLKTFNTVLTATANNVR